MSDLEKLVRDHIPKIIRAAGETPLTRQASYEELPAFLRAKLDEEVAEFRASDDEAELVDILEVVYAIAGSRGISIERLEKLRLRKRMQRGGFEQRIVLILGEGPPPAA